MLIEIEPAELELGMFIHRLQGNWFHHPFWKSRFLLTEAGDREAIAQSRVRSVVIDLSRGKGPAADGASQAALSPAAPAPLRPGGFGRRIDAPLVPARPAPARLDPEATRSVTLARNCDDAIGRVFLKARLGKGVAIADVDTMIGDIFGSIQRNPYAFNGLLRCREASEETFRHALTVCALMIALARRLKLPPAETREAGMAGLLMDLGVSRLTIDMAPLQHDHRALAPELFYQHILFGADYLGAAGDLPASVITVCWNHHERVDGSGRPNRLAGGELDRMCRMAAVCDDFDYLVNGGLHSAPLDPAAALQQMVRNSAGYDPEILAAFADAVGIYPVGTFVELQSGAIAMVVDINPDAPGQPVVRPFLSLRTGRWIRRNTIDLANCWGSEAIAGLADLSPYDLPPPPKLRAKVLAAARKG